MFFSESEPLANANPDSQELLVALDLLLSQSAPSTLLLPRRVSSQLGASRTQVAALLELLTNAGLLCSQDMLECECGVLAPEDELGERCSSCDDVLVDSMCQRVYRLSESAQSQIGAASEVSNDTPQPTPSHLSGDKKNALQVAYSGIWGSKVIWLAVFTFAPLVIGLKVPGLRIHVGLATLLYASYHALGAMNWLRLRQLRQAPDAHSPGETELLWQNISKRHRIAKPLSYTVLALLLLTVVAKIDLNFGSSSRPICLPNVAYTLIAVSPPASCR